MSLGGVSRRVMLCNILSLCLRIRILSLPVWVAEEFNARLDTIFTQARKTIFGGGKVAFAFSGLNSPYNHGNQPSLHIPWLFNFSGKPYLTQKWTRLICDEFYGTDGEHGYGYGQDEDQGQLGSWYVLSAMGLFDVQGGACSELPISSEVQNSMRLQFV